jgi:flavin-dependent dehydrogenase
MTIRARTSPSGGRGGVVVTRRRCERWLPERAMVAGASDIDSSSCYSSSSSSDEKEQHKGKRSSKNINGLCFAAQETRFWSWMANLEIIVWVINRARLNF